MSLHVFAVEVDNDKDAIYFAEQSSLRASGVGLHNLFARWIIFEHKRDEDNNTIIYVVAVKSNFPDAWKIFATIAAVPFILAGLSWTWWMVPGLVLFGLSFLASTTFRYWVFRIGLRRYGYQGRIKKLDSDEIIADILEDRRDQWHKAR